ncbi:hypothetical protein LMG31506_02996 [Cupriavidus yeoncheonensis]|uniref:Holin n=1 Tax=Cupriavidus yeoncheonensis TaxID=1462994 RepID=A0A916IXK4_9BURK|nr:hypothetical protein [Cupriavidus yeoncheonensis]CAG2144393.1 hypothetical protein LMG31506_02996 [Cupriavidus yeoncheonensis]
MFKLLAKIFTRVAAALCVLQIASIASGTPLALGATAEEQGWIVVMSAAFLVMWAMSEWANRKPDDDTKG